MKIKHKNCPLRASTLWGLWLLLSFIIFQPNLLGQTITVTPGQTFSATISSATVYTIAPYQLTYLLVNSGGTVVASNTTGSFAGQAAGVYTIYAINYDSTDPLAVIPTVGAAYAAPGGCSTELSRLVQVQNCLSVCPSATLTAPTISSATLSGTYRLDYVFICGATVTVNAATADGGTGSTSFTAPATPQTCTLYAINYDNAAGTPTYSGNLDVSGNLEVLNNVCHTVIDRCVTVNALPTLTLSNISNACPTATADLATAITSSLTGLTPAYFQSDGTTPVATPSAVTAGTYVVRVTDNATGCTNTGNVVVTINPCSCTPATICEGDAFGLQTVGDVNNTTGYSVALVLVCNNAVVSVTDAADVGTPDATIGVSAGTITDVAPPPGSCSIFAINYQGTGLATGDITPTGSNNQITVAASFTCLEKIEKCYTINPKTPKPVVANEEVCLNGSVTVTPTPTTVPSPIYISALLANQGTTNDANGNGTVDFCDEYIEITALCDIDLSGFTLTDNSSTRHTFPAGSVLTAGQKIVLFGGSAPASTATTIYQNLSNGPGCGTGVWNNTGGDIATILNGTTIMATANYAGAPPLGTAITYTDPGLMLPATFDFYDVDPTVGSPTPFASDAASITIDDTSTPINTTAAGAYDVWVVVSNGCCSGDTAKLTVTVNPLPVFTLAPTDPTCAALSSGSILVSGLTPNQAGYTVAYTGPTTGSLTNQTASATGTINIPNLTGNATPNNYTVTVTNAAGCTASDNATVVAPTCTSSCAANAGDIPQVSFCQGASANPTPAGWTADAAFGGAYGPAPSPTADYSFQYFIVNDVPAPYLIQTAYPVNTLPTTADFNALLPGVYRLYRVSWNSNATAGGGTLEDATGGAVGAGDNVETLSTSAAVDCIDLTYTYVTVRPTPVVSASNNGAVCVGAALILTATQTNAAANPVSYAWTGPNTYTSANQSPTIVNAQASHTGTYSVTVTTAFGCTAGANTTATVNAPPVANAGADIAVCSGSGATIGSTAVVGNTYLWSTGATAASITVTPTVATNYTVTVTNTTTGCTATDNVLVTVNQAPIPVVGNNGPLCDTRDILLTASGGTSYQWSGPLGFTSTDQNPAILASSIPPFPGPGSWTYNVTVTLGACSATASTVVVVNDSPNIAPSSNSPVCVGSTINLSANYSNTTASDTYSWTGPVGFTSGVANPTISNALPGNAGVYTLTVANASGCVTVGQVTVGLAAVPNATISKSVICSGTTGTINLSVPSAGIGSTYVWSGTGATGTGNNQSIAGMNNGTYPYTVTITSSLGCTASSSTSVIVSCTPTCTANAGVATAGSACPNTPIPVTVTGNNTGCTTNVILTTTSGTILYVGPSPIPGQAAGSYLLYSYNSCTSPTIPPAAGLAIAPYTAGTASGGCYDVSNTGSSFSINPATPALAGYSAITQGNQGGISPFAYNTETVTICGGTLPYNYIWDNNGYVRYDILYANVDCNNDGTIDGPGALITVIYADQATWAVTVTSSSNCGTVTPVSFNNIPGEANMLLDIDNYTITEQSGTPNGAIAIMVTGGTCGGAYTYQWSGPNGFTAITPNISGLAYGWYSVTVTCGSETTQGWYWVPRHRRGRTKAGDDPASGMTVYPNPLSQAATLDFYSAQGGYATVKLFAADGKEVKTLFEGITEAEKDYSLPIDATYLPSGVYIASLLTESGEVLYEKVVITK